MSPLWCWRCRRTVPMLDDDEWAALTRGLQAIQAHRAATGATLAEALAHTPAPYAEALGLYEQIKGHRETDPLLWHHRASIYGPPCAACGKSLRTPQATVCAACGAAVS